MDSKKKILTIIERRKKGLLFFILPKLNHKLHQQRIDLKRKILLLRLIKNINEQAEDLDKEVILSKMGNVRQWNNRRADLIRAWINFKTYTRNAMKREVLN